MAGTAILLTAALSVKAVDVIYEVRSGYPSGVGIPSILWVAMGLQETEGRAKSITDISRQHLQITIANRNLPRSREKNISGNGWKNFHRILEWHSTFSKIRWRASG